MVRHSVWNALLFCGVAMTDYKIEVLFTYDTPTGRVRAVVGGQICGPSLPVKAEDFNANKQRYHDLFEALFVRGALRGSTDTQQAVRSALGLSK
jgi:hypothetical protein